MHLIGFLALVAFAQTAPRQDGFFPFLWNEKEGKLFLTIDRWNTEFLYVSSLPAGLGSNDVGLDRGRLGDTKVVRFERYGPKVLLVESNYGFRAVSNDAEERRAVKESFAESVLWGFKVESETGTAVTVDATGFFLRDAVDAAGTLKRTRQGGYKLDGTRSTVYPPRTRNFPRNTEVEAILTFTGEPEGRFVREVAPDAGSITLREHHSFVELPELGGYQPRAFDPRAGYFGPRYMDYATPVGEPVVKRSIARHRLKKKNPGAQVSEAVQPVTYYLDRGTPEPIRSALLDGARWWAQAFEAIGYRDAFRVELMPEGADAMDVRYNVIQWVHRSTRGWSYGAGVQDPRTGEILKGHVTLGSLRVRQDYLIAEGLLAPYEDGKAVPKAMLEMALARLRQLAAHEVGHSLGLMHNYAASSMGRASVMDYPHPLIRLGADGSIDLAEAYATGIGEWDKVAIAYGYQDFGEGEAAGRLTEILARAHQRGLYFAGDDDARPEGSAHPQAHLWDNGANAADELRRLLEVRRRALERFSERNIPVGRPFSTLEEPLVTTFLLHRYQTEAAVKMIGGLEYSHAVRGDGRLITRMVTGAEQRRALEAVLETLKPESLTVPERILQLIPPAAPDYDRTREYFPSRTGLTFDPLAAAEGMAGHAVRLLLNPERASRLLVHAGRDARNPGLGEVIDRLLGATWKRGGNLRGLEVEVSRVVDNVVLNQLMTLGVDEAAAGQARAVVNLRLEQLREWLQTQAAVSRDEDRKAHLMQAASRIRKYQEEMKAPAGTKAVELPPGQPI